jgi:5,10-methylene-tetrahydrofolate dehydrogenase/methenyl tetrahydrofolate cyclohydrolase
MDRAENVVLPVPPGVGQMHLAIVLAGMWAFNKTSVFGEACGSR